MSPEIRSGVRWGRLWFTTTLVFAALLAILAIRSRAPTTTFHLDWPSEADCVLERVASLCRPPPPDDGHRFATLRQRTRRLEAKLPPGHYRISLREAGSAETITLPLLVTRSRNPITWNLSQAAPKGYVPVPPGPFIRGPAGEIAETAALIFAARCEVTRAEYARFLDALEGLAVPPGGFTPHCGEAERIAFPRGVPGHGDRSRPEHATRPEHSRYPATWVSWYDAQAYARWLTASAGDGSLRYRLPTKLEWEKLWRGTDGRLYPWGNEFRRDPFREATDIRLRDVDSLPERRSPYGLFHMDGNVAEWVADAADPSALSRVVLGRSWSSQADLVRQDARIGDAADRRAPEIGFRLVAERVPRP